VGKSTGRESGKVSGRVRGCVSLATEHSTRDASLACEPGGARCCDDDCGLGGRETVNPEILPVISFQENVDAGVRRKNGPSASFKHTVKLAPAATVTSAESAAVLAIGRI
jgi:hypothetical protein